MLGGIWGWLVEHLFERLGEHLVAMGLVWLFSKVWVLFSKIWVGMALAFAVTLVVVLIAWLVDTWRSWR